jgi:hypothetical protein
MYNACLIFEKSFAAHFRKTNHLTLTMVKVKHFRM